MAEVYWIHLPEHTDVFTEGYVGITSKTTKDRYKGHIKDSKRSDRNKYPVHNAINKYNDLLVVETLCICSNEYAVNLESLLRPTPKIGWNVVAGGNDVSFVREVKQQLKHTEESKCKMKLSQKEAWEKHRDSKLAHLFERRKSLSTPKSLNGEAIRFWFTRSKTPKNLHLWAMCDEFHSYYMHNKVTVTDVLNKFNLPDKNRCWMRKTLAYFVGGWNPISDHLWLEDFKGVSNGSPAI